MSQENNDPVVDLEKLQLEIAPAKKKTRDERKYSKEKLFDDENDPTGWDIAEEGAENDEEADGGVFQRMRYVSKKIHDKIAGNIRSVDSILKAQEQEENESGSGEEPRQGYEYEEEQQRKRRIKIGAGVLAVSVLVLIVIIISVAASGGNDGGVNGGGSGEFPPLFEGESLLEIKNKTQFGFISEETFVARTSSETDRITFLSACSNTPISCLGVGFAESGSVFVGDCFSDCQGATSEFLDPLANQVLIIAGVVLEVAENGLNAAGLSFEDEENIKVIEFGASLQNIDEADENVFFVSRQEEVEEIELVGFFGTLNGTVITSLGFITKPIQ